VSATDVLWLGLMIGLPTLVAARLFHVEPEGRWFVATWALAVIGASVGFWVIALLLILLDLNFLGMFDGIVAAGLSIPIAAIVGVVIRSRRARKIVIQ
jgi:hypothetical protein